MLVYLTRNARGSFASRQLPPEPASAFDLDHQVLCRLLGPLVLWTIMVFLTHYLPLYPLSLFLTPNSRVARHDCWKRRNLMHLCKVILGTLSHVLTAHTKPIGGKWIYSIKLKSDGLSLIWSPNQSKIFKLSFTNIIIIKVLNTPLQGLSWY